MSKKPNSLSRQLSTSLILMAAPVFILSMGIFFVQSHYLIHKESRDYTSSILHTSLQRVVNYMGTIETSARSNVWLLEQNFVPDSLAAVSHRIVTLNPNVLSSAVSVEPDVFPKYGRSFSVYTSRTFLPSTGRQAKRDTVTTVCETNYDYFDKSWYKKPRRTDEPCWVDPFADFNEGAIDHQKAVASFCLPLHDKSGRFVGVVSTECLFATLAACLNEVKLPYPNAHFMLLGSDGRYLVHPDSMRLFRKTIYSEADPSRNADIIALGHEMQAGNTGLMHVTHDGVYRHICYAPVPGTDWCLALVCPDDEILTDYYHLTYIVCILIVVGLLLILWLSHRVPRETINPINRLIRMTEKMADGDYSNYIPPTNRNDLVAQLQNSFSRMQQALQDHMTDIERATKKLDKNIKQREHKLKVAEKALHDKDEFVQHVSHHVRTPLNIIVGFSNLLHEHVRVKEPGKNTLGPLEEENLKDIVATMQHHAVLLKRMVLMLFDTSDVGTIEESKCERTEELNCNDLARETIDYTLDHFPGLEIRLETELSDNTYILSNYIYLARTLRELLYNAATHSDKKNIVLSVRETESTVCYTVQDTGPGLPENPMFLFDKPFIRINDLSEGLGLGLPLCKRHARTLGGGIVVDTLYKEGCRITVVLPK